MSLLKKLFGASEAKQLKQDHVSDLSSKPETLFSTEENPIKSQQMKEAEEWSDKGAHLTVSGRHKDAIACYDKALKINPELSITWFNKGKSFAALGSADEATKCVIKAASLGLKEAQKVCEQSGTLYKLPDLDADAKISEGIALGKLGRWQDALAYYDKALELTPMNPKGWLNKGQSLRKLGRLPEAVESFQQFVKYANPAKDAQIVAAVKKFIANPEA
jgi:tetratricopeptide (TPR) repeat protein